MNIDQEKKEIRKRIRERKKSFSLDQKRNKSKSIFEKLEKLDHFKESSVIMVYWSMDDEVYTHEFVQNLHGKKRIILPIVKGDTLILKEFSGMSKMKIGEQFGIAEPIGKPFEEVEQLDLIIVPGVAFDEERNRLGRGKAYYDKLLKSTTALKVGVCFDFQLIDKVPVDEHDIKMDLIISD